ncbi:hypothetical protein N7452_004256 [Penicillium brevicompactum]|uniref:Uncharacterized protein n=1 Tax=Penicillium brevicompactum TaxID=5074 RepID=A0A9W9UKR5_PENBR|nr:hypothetical protein N7452_004256 [Penicillium brevicompactum]
MRIEIQSLQPVLRDQILRVGFPSTRHHVRVLDLACAVPGVATSQHAPLVLPYAATKYFIQWMYDVRRNKLLFWSIMVGLITMFPILYIPVLNDVVFKHKPMAWEWGIVAVEAVLFFICVEA